MLTNNFIFTPHSCANSVVAKVSNNLNAGYFHGDIHFFFPDSVEYYHTDFTTPPPADVPDMYTVTLHEVMHMLGFASLIGESGQSKFPTCIECYSRYDSYLKFKNSGFHLIAQNSGSGINCEDVEYNGPQSLATGCEDGVIFDGDNNPNQDVFSPTSWSSASLSHFDCADDLTSCPFQNSPNVMNWCNNGGPDFTKRHPSQAEANTFCDLGYHRYDSWGTPGDSSIFKTYDACSSTPCLENLVAYNDFTYPDGQPIMVSAISQQSNPIDIDVTFNDLNVTAVSCASVVSGPGSVVLVPGSPKKIRYTPATTAFVGYVIIKYRGFRKCNNIIIESNDAYVFIRVQFPPTCPENDCNLICGGDFEGTPFASAFAGFNILGTPGNTPDIYRRELVSGDMKLIKQNGVIDNTKMFLIAGCNGSVPFPDPYDPSSQSYIGFLGYPSIFDTINGVREGIMFNLNQPMLPTKEYKLSFWARGSHEDCLPTISVWGDSVRPCIPPDATHLNGTVSPCGFTAETLATRTLTDQWLQYTITITPMQEIKFIVIAFAIPITIESYTLIDDVVLLQEPNPLNLSISSEVDNPSPCSGGTVTIEYNIELAGDDLTNPNPIYLQAVLPTGFSVVMPSDFSITGQDTIPANTLMPGVPYTLTLVLQLDPNNISPGTSYEIPLNITDNGSACYNGNSASNTVIVTPKDALLSISTTASSSFVHWGDVITIYVEVCNQTNQPLNGVVVTDVLPPDLAFSSSTDFTLNGDTLESLPFDLPANEPGLPPYCVPLSFEAKFLSTALCPALEDCATASYPPCTDVSDCVQISSTNAEIELANTDNLDPALQPNVETGKKISIMGTFTVLSGTSYTFNDCDILMQPDAEIVLEPDATLHIENGTHLYACDDLWKSITVNNNATLFINGGSIIQDARRAVDVPATDATLNINGCTFRNNYIGIYAHYGNNAVINGMIRNSIFECPDSVFEYNKKTYAGIYLSHVNIPNIRDCSFSQMNFGVYANASPLQIRFCHFENIQPYYTGVEFIIVNAPVEYPTLIRQTKIECSDYGIKGLVLSPQQNPLIHSNFVEVTDTSQNGVVSGIFVESDIVQSAVTIINNTVHVEDGEFGIFIRNFLDATVVLNGSDDPIQLNSSNATGIQIENTHSGFVGCNYVTDGSSMDNTTGINIVSSPLIEFDCNHVDSTAVGLRINGVCNTPENFKGTDFGDHATGFQIINFGRIGAQTHRGNIWDGTALLEAQNLGDPVQSPFIVDENVPDFLPNPIFPLNWFAPETPTNDSYFCNQSSCPLSKPAPAPVVDNVDLLIAGGASSRPTTSSPQSLEWMSASYLYEKLKAYPDLADQNSILTDFIDDYASSSAGELFDLHQQTINIATFGFDTLAFLNQVADINSHYTQRLLEIDSLLSLSPADSIFEALLSEQLTILQSLRKNTWKTEQLQAALNNLIAEKSSDLQVNNDAVVSGNILETNYQTVHSIWLQSVGIGKPDLLYDHDSVLYEIAHQCPYEGGWAVYWARGLYSYMEHQSYDDDQLCATAQERMAKPAIVLNPELSIVPNPANDMVSLSWTLEHTTEARLIITNTLQQPVFSSKTNSSSIDIDVKSFHAGVYYVFVIQEGKIVLSKPFIIAK